MKIIVAVCLFLIFISLSPLIIQDTGYIRIVIWGSAVETTVWAAVVFLVLAFIALLFSLKVLRGSLRLGFGTWHKITFAGRRRALRNFNKGIASYVLEDYQQAEHLLAKSAELSPCENTAYLLAAASAEKQNLSSNIQHYLNLIVDDKHAVKELGLDSILVRIKLLMAQKKYPGARALIDEYHKHIGHDARLLALEIELCLIEARYPSAIEYLNSARKKKEFSEAQIIAWEDTAFYQHFAATIREKDQTALAAEWQGLPRKVKQREAVLFAYCQVLAEQNMLEPLNNILLAPMKKDASEQFLHRVRSLPLSKPVSLISAVQKHLQQNSQSAKWLSMLGHLAVAGQEWLMAEKAFSTLSNLEGEQYDQADLIAFAKALNAQGNLQAANKLYAKIIGNI
ncbi:heme biosynthesis HemY N-terminal domain-containing protein [Thalassotalea sp. PLHSN55]|uniref:heme biosynthesis HemY N-terminal domain-containing protein n=1 Tax=Thalassotalea sp. PLHSN55 TaxID=3435888 RepID=UPI003F85CC56